MENIFIWTSEERSIFLPCFWLTRLVLPFDKWQSYLVNQHWADPAPDPAWALFWAGSGFPSGQISFSCLNLVRSSGTKSIAPIQSVLKGRQLSKGTQVKAGDSRWNSVIIFQMTSRLWSLVMLLWPTSDLSPQIQFGVKLCLSSEYGVPFCSWNKKSKWKYLCLSYLVKMHIEPKIIAYSKKKKNQLRKIWILCY